MQLDFGGSLVSDGGSAPVSMLREAGKKFGWWWNHR